MLQFFIFEIIPMCNPDGVVVGNNRSNLSGFDMNRRWENPDPILDCEVFSIKNYISKLKKKIHIFFDLHGHSTKKGCFLFANESTKNFNSFNWISERLFIKIMERHCNPYFDI